MHYGWIDSWWYGERLHRSVSLWEDITTSPPDFSDMRQRFPALPIQFDWYDPKDGPQGGGAHRSVECGLAIRAACVQLLRGSGLSHAAHQPQLLAGADGQRSGLGPARDKAGSHQREYPR